MLELYYNQEVLWSSNTWNNLIDKSFINSSFFFKWWYFITILLSETAFFFYFFIHHDQTLLTHHHTCFLIIILSNSILLESAKGRNSSTQEAYIRDTQLGRRRKHKSKNTRKHWQAHHQLALRISKSYVYNSWYCFQLLLPATWWQLYLFLFFVLFQLETLKTPSTSLPNHIALISWYFSPSILMK